MLNQDKKEILKQLGTNLRDLREYRGYTQEELANELGLEISQISRIERGVINTSIYTIITIAVFLKADYNSLFSFN